MPQSRLLFPSLLYYSPFKGSDSKSPLSKGGGVRFFLLPRKFFIVTTPNFFWEFLRMYGRTTIQVEGIYLPPKHFTACKSSKIMKISTFYYISGTYKLHLEWVSNYKNYHPFTFSFQKMFLCMWTWLFQTPTHERNFFEKCLVLFCFLYMSNKSSIVGKYIV